MIVCVCHRVSDQHIARAARNGMAFDDIQLEFGVATQCGKCESCARAVWAECSPGLNTAHIFQTPVTPASGCGASCD
ncbi:MAG: (2Fe-2S)-binding protein [Burkholderiales bacterium]|nr:MAG: (2Fe-2S)-binding protein [Burkholderiales bacterium]